MRNRAKRNSSERGVAIIFALLAILVLGILGATLMFTAQSQAWTSLNYRQAMQARYAAEAGVQKTINWLASSSYTGPTVYTPYNMNVNPVTCVSGCATTGPVVLSAISGVSSNYPTSSVATAFTSALSNQAIPGLPNVTVSTKAVLLRMTQSSGAAWLPSSGTGVIQTWQITSIATISGASSSSVQVVENFERTGTSIFNYGLEALGTGCGIMTFVGKDSTDSYNSSLGPYGGSNVGNEGNIATNGNVTLQGTGTSAAKINGNVAAVNSTVGACASSGLTDSSSGNYLGLKAVGTLVAPLPWGCTAQPCYPPGTNITTAQNVSSSCISISGCTKNSPATISLNDGGSNRTVNAFTLAPGSYGNITINNADVVHVSAGTYNINSLNFAQDGQIVVDSGPVVFNLVGNCSSGCPSESGLPSGYSSTEVIYGSGYAGFNACAPSGGTGTVANPNVYGSTTCGPSKGPYSGIASNLQIVYGGSQTLRLGGMPNATVLYAPSAGYYTPGAPVGLYGSAIVKMFNDQSGSPFHYDTALPNEITKVGPYLPVGGFSWSKF
jgi:Tfp pilus assembly protein PilX